MNSIFKWLWLGFGVVLLISEFVTPSLSAVFFGISAILVGVLQLSGVLEHQGVSTFLWLLSSGSLFWLLRATLLKHYRPEIRRDITSEEARAYGSVVDVVAEINPQDQSGRIRFDGTSWPAISRGGIIPTGAKARLLHRENLAWVVVFAGDDQTLPGLDTSKSGVPAKASAQEPEDRNPHEKRKSS